MTDLFLLFGVLPSNDAVVNLKGEKKKNLGTAKTCVTGPTGWDFAKVSG